MPDLGGAAPVQGLRGARWSVALLFFANGATIANWVPRIPEVRAGLDLGAGALGAALLGLGLGGLLASLAAGPVIARVGSRAVSVGSGLALCAALALPALAPGWLALFAALGCIGLADGAMDVSMNAHGVAVQRGYGRPILNRLHAMWSLGALAGAVTGALAAGAGVAPSVHLAATGLVLGAVILCASKALLPAHTDRVSAADVRLVRPSRALAVLGLVALCAAVVEVAPQDWSAVYLADELAAAPGLAGAGYAAFAAAMLLARVFGDGAIARWGPAPIVRAGALLAAGGLVLAVSVGTVWSAIAGFGAVGAGVATMVPVLFSAAGSLPGVEPGVGISMVALVCRGGGLASPPLIGAVADAAGFPVALGLVALSAMGVAVLAPRVVPDG